MTRLLVAGLAAVALALTGCEQRLSPSAERGTCHGPDPAQAGPVGPAVKGSSRELLEAKVLRGAYPPGYTPKRSTKVMVPMPALAGEIGALADYLR